MVHPEHHLGDVLLLHQHLMVAAVKTLLGEEASPLEFI
jgi:hypothetical protein